MTSVLLLRVRQFPWFFAVATLWGVLVVFGGIGLWRQLGRWRGAVAENERLRIETLTPQVRPEMVAVARAAAADADKELGVELARWPGMHATAAATDALGAYAELSVFVERCQAAASAVGVAYGKGERFGFARFANEAPPVDRVAAVLISMHTVERALAAVFAARPERLCGVAVDLPDAEGGLRGVRSVRAAGQVDARALRVEFEGSGECLRQVLDVLANDGSFVIRDVAVSLPGTKDVRAKPSPRTGSAVRTFAVTMEAIAVVGGQGGPMAAPPAIRTAARGALKGFSLFGPAERALAPGGARLAEAGWDTVELLAVRRVPYRWRLVGHAGSSAAAQAILEETATRRVVLLGVGEREPESGAVLERLDFRAGDDGGRTVCASLRDPAEAELVRLEEGGADGPARLRAVLRVRDSAAVQEVAEGATVRGGGFDHMVESISAEPANVALRRLAPGRPAEVRRLGVTAE